MLQPESLGFLVSLLNRLDLISLKLGFILGLSNFFFLISVCELIFHGSRLTTGFIWSRDSGSFTNDEGQC